MMVTESRRSRTHHVHYERHQREYYHRQRRRHHTLDNSTLDKFNFICVPLNRIESRSGLSSSHTNLTVTQPTQFSTTSKSVQLPSSISTMTRRVHFKFDDNDKNKARIDINNHQYTRSSEDLRLPETKSIHRVEFQIPMRKDTNPWLNSDYLKSSQPAKTRCLTSKKIDIRYPHKSSIRLQGIAPFIEAEINPQKTSIHEPEKIQSHWYRQMYGHLHKPPETKQEHQENPYQPTYSFPDEFNGDPDAMEEYIRKKAKPDHRNGSSSPIRTLNPNTSDKKIVPKQQNTSRDKVLRFEDQYLPTNERFKVDNDMQQNTFPAINTNLQSNLTHMQTVNDGEKVMYKSPSHEDDNLSDGIQKSSDYNQGKNA